MNMDQLFLNSLTAQASTSLDGLAKAIEAIANTNLTDLQKTHARVKVCVAYSRSCKGRERTLTLRGYATA